MNIIITTAKQVYLHIFGKIFSLVNWSILVLYILIFVSLGYGQLERINPLAATSLYMHDVLILSVITIMFFSQRTKIIEYAEKLISKTPVAVWILVAWFGLGVITHNIFSIDENQLMYLSRILLYSVFTWMTWLLFSHARKALFWMVTFSLGLHLYFGMLQYLFMPDTRFLKILGWDDHYYRLIGPLFDPNFTGLLLVLLFLLIIYIKKNLNVYAFYIALVAISTATALTFSRSTYLAWIVAAMILAGYQWLRHSKQSTTTKTLILSSFILACTIIIAPKPGGEGVNLARTSTIKARAAAAERQATHSLETRRLFIGEGLFAKPDLPLTADISRGRLPDNLILLFLQGGGVIGIVLLSYVAFTYGWPAVKQHPFAVASLGAVITHSQFNNSLFHPFVFLYLLLILPVLVKKSE